jgi:DNA polymerase-3 subunit gamma/tau
VIEIDAASHGGVDDARDLRERAFYSPVTSRYKIYIIDEAHMVTGGGFNALLKLVEEPPPHLKFVFATTEPEKVIATIKSRTHHYPFRLVPPAVLREHLEQILASEGVPYEPAVLPVVIRAGAGSVRDALSVLDQLIAGSDDGGLRYDRAIALLGYSDDRLLDEVIEGLAAGDGAAVFHTIDHVVEAGHDPRRFAADLLDRLRDLIVLSAVPDAAISGLIDAPPDRLEEMSKQSAAFGRPGLTRAAEIISAGLVEMRGATSPRLPLELMCAQVLLPSSAADVTGLAERVERLERGLAAGSRPPTAQQPQPEQRQPEQPRRAQQRTGSAAFPGSAQPARGPAVSAPAMTGAPAGSTGDRRLDTQTLRTRWPDVLAAVEGRRKVAWMQLSHASVGSLADGVLTLSFAQPGTAKGFLSGGYDKVLSEVLTEMFGVTPAITTTVGAPAGVGTDLQTGTGPSASPPRAAPPGGHPPMTPQDPRPGTPRESRAGGTPGQARGVVRRPAPSAAADNEPASDDLPAPEALTGTGLIERELGGRIIEELGGQ